MQVVDQLDVEVIDVYNIVMHTKWNIGNLNKGKHLSPVHRDKISLTKKRLFKEGKLVLPDNLGKTPWNFGKKWTKEVRNKISKTKKGSTPWNLGIAHTKETKIKISKTRRGIPAWNRGLGITEERRKAISEAMKKKWRKRKAK